MKQGRPLTIHQLNLKSGNQELCRNFSLEVGPHQLISLMGENGVGKTSLLEAICGVRKIEGGEVLFWDRPLADYDSFEIFSKVGWVTSAPESYPLGLKVSELFQFLSQIHRNWNSKLAHGLCESFRLVPEKKLAHLSLGEHSKVRLIKAMAFEPELLLLDELTANLSPDSKDAVLSALLDLFNRTEMSVLYVCHSKEEAIRLSDRVIEFPSKRLK
ncbi:MAG: ATP-binding cassette domain-containing protein [Bdellovibrionia bacterium]